MLLINSASVLAQMKFIYLARQFFSHKNWPLKLICLI